jgi:hypothetical protein
MNNLIRNTHLQIALLILFTLILAGCASPATGEPTAIPVTIPETGESQLQAALTANQSKVILQDEGQPEVSLARFETVNVPTGELIISDEQGRGVLRFGDRNEVNLFGSTEVLLDDLKLEPGGSIFARLKQNAGHLHLLLNEQSVTRVTLETDDSTITTLEQGTEFAICFAPGKLTCIAVQEGAIEVISQNEKAIYRSGEATYYTPDQPPQPAICIQEEQLNQWLNEKRGPGEVQTLGQLVQSWPQQTCDQASAPSPTAVAEATAVPSSPTPLPAETPLPTLTPTSDVPPGVLYVRINNITIDDQNRYVVEYETFEYTEQLPGMHVHFFFDTVPPEQAGVPGSGPWKLYGGPRPFTEYTIDQRPPQALQMCALVANSDHSVHLNSGNCFILPESP